MTSACSKVATSSSTTALALEDRFAEVINVRDYGATGIGGPKDDAAIRAAIAASSKGAVYFPPGTYVINSPLKITKPVVLTGAGNNSVIKAVDCNGAWPHTLDDTFPLISIRPDTASFSGVTVENLSLDGNCASRSYAGSQFNAGVEVAAFGKWIPRNVRLRQLSIRDVAGDGITVRGDPTTSTHLVVPSDIFIEDNLVERWHKDRQGIAVVAGSRLSITNNRLILGIPSSGVCPAKTSEETDPSNSNFGIDLETNREDTGAFITHVQISGNVIHNCNGGINIANSNYPKNAISNVSTNDNSAASYAGRPLKPMQVTGKGVSGSFN